MQFFLTLIEDVEGIIFKVDQKDFLHLVGNFVKEASNIFVAVIVI